MCQIDSLKTIPRKAFRFKRSEYGYMARYQQYEINIERTGDYWWWDVHYKVTIGYQIAESDFTYKTNAITFIQAKKRAITQLNKWRMINL